MTTTTLDAMALDAMTLDAMTTTQQPWSSP